LIQKLVLLFEIYGAMRIGEITALQWEDVELEQENRALEVTIRRSKNDPTSRGFKFIVPSNKDFPDRCPLILFLKYQSFVQNPTGTHFLREKSSKFINSPLEETTLQRFYVKLYHF
jgi:integrase